MLATKFARYLHKVIIAHNRSRITYFSVDTTVPQRVPSQSRNISVNYGNASKTNSIQRSLSKALEVGWLNRIEVLLIGRNGISIT